MARTFAARSTRAGSLFYCTAAYVVAAAIAFLVGLAEGGGGSAFGGVPVPAAAAGDLAATIVVFAFSVIADNSSVYDPYWSVAPILIVGFWLAGAFGAVGGGAVWAGGGATSAGVVAHGRAASAGAALRAVLVFAAVAAWGIRLTYNWIRRWRGLRHEDWRYADFRNRPRAVYWAVSLLGFHLFPTILVFFGCVAVYPAFTLRAAPLGAFDVAGIVVCAGAVWIEATSDRQLHRFMRERRDHHTVLDRGLWRIARHPNYVGEVAFWWGLYLFGLAADASRWWTVAGPAAITALFIFVSVPMMERHMIARHPGASPREGYVRRVLFGSRYSRK